MDPRLETNMDALTAYKPLMERRDAMTVQLASAAKQLRDAQKMTGKLAGLMPDDESEAVTTLSDTLTSINKRLGELEEKLFGPEESKGYTDNSETMISQFYRLGGYLSPENVPPSGTAETLLTEIEGTIGSYIEEVNAFFSGPWTDMMELVSEVEFEIVSEFPVIGEE